MNAQRRVPEHSVMQEKEMHSRWAGLRLWLKQLLNRPLSIQWKVVVVFVLLILLALQVISVYFLRSMENYYVSNFTETLYAQGSVLAVNLERYLAADPLPNARREGDRAVGSGEALSPEEREENIDDIDYLVNQFFAQNGVQVQVLDKNGVIISATWDAQDWVGQKNNRTEASRALSGVRDESIRVDPESGQRKQLMGIPVQREGRVLGAVYLESSMEGLYQTIGKITTLFATGIAIALVLTAALGVLVARTISNPIKEITRQAKAMAEGDYSRQVAVLGGDEIGQLGEAFNHLSRQLKEALSANEKEQQKRKEFVANVSHELRTPLTTINSYLEALSDGSVEDRETARRFLAVARKETSRMIRLVNDLLQLSRLESAEVNMPMTRVELCALVTEVAERFRLPLVEREITLKLILPEALPPVLAVRDQVEQVLDNLLSNAMKYTSAGGQISLSVTDQRGEMAVVEVADTGIGILEEDLDRIFDRFYRVDKARSRQMGGTGLGLSIAKEVVEMHGGQIEIESEWGKGTTIRFTLPYIEERKAV